MRKIIGNAAVGGIVLGASVAMSGAQAGVGQPFSLQEAINDYSSVNVQTAEPMSSRTATGYTYDILLDEAFADYQSDVVAADQADRDNMESAEFAMFEPASRSSLTRSWLIIPQD